MNDSTKRYVAFYEKDINALNDEDAYKMAHDFALRSEGLRLVQVEIDTTQPRAEKKH